MSVHVEWMGANSVVVELVENGAEMPDGQLVDQGGALVFGQDEAIVIEGTPEELRKLGQRVVRTLEPHRFANLEREVKRARKAAEGVSNDVEIERLQEALDVALTILGRDDLR